MEKTLNWKVFRKGSILRWWGISYLLILLIPVVTSIATYSYTNNTILQEVASTNRVQLNRIVAEIDSTAKQMESILNSSIMNEQLTTVLNSKQKQTEFINRLPSCVKMLQNYLVAAPDLDIMIYIPETDYLITGNTANSTDNIYKSLNVYKGLSLPLVEYRSLFLENIPKIRYFLSDKYSYSSHGINSVVLTRTLSSPFTSAYSANIYVTIPLIKFTSKFSSGNENGLLIYDNDGSLIYSNRKFSDLAAMDFEEALVKNIEYRINDMNYIASSAKSPSCGWTFVTLIPQKNYFYSIRYITTVTLISVCIAVLLGLCSILILLRHNYRPIKKMLNKMGQSDLYKGKNEFDTILDFYTKVYYDSLNARQQLTTQQEAFRKNYIFSHLRGNRHVLSDEDLQEYLHFDPKGKNYVIITVLLNNMNQYVHMEAVEFVIISAFNESLGNQYHYYQQAENQLITYLFMINTEQISDFEDNIHTKLTGIIEYLKEKTDMSVTVILSDISDNFDELPSVYGNILAAAEYQSVINTCGILKTSDLEKYTYPASNPTENKLTSLLCESIRVRRYTDAKSIVTHLFALLYSEKKSSFRIDQFRVFSWAQILSAAFFSDEEEPSSYRQFIHQLTELSECRTITEMEECFKKIVQGCCKVSAIDAENVKYTEDSLSDRVQHYVSEFYSDFNLCLSSIANELNLSSKYLSQLFKSETGSGLLDYINQVRIGHAIALMENDNYTISEIFEKVGYNNVKTFRRAFLKITGVTPSEFKNERLKK